MKKILILLAIAAIWAGCDDLFSPAVDNNGPLESANREPAFAQGILANAYLLYPYNIYSFNDVATDDAVTNQTSNNYHRMATGSWAANNNPMDRWTSCRGAIQYINLFLEIADNISWSDDEIVNSMFNDRLKGEAYGLRAMYMYYLLEAHGGWTADKRLLGVPIVTQSEDIYSDYNYPRNTFDECVQQIYKDVQEAEKLLPLDFEDVNSISDMLTRYQNLGANTSQYTRVFGQRFRLRMTARIAKTFRAKTALLAASPAYSEGTTVTWAQAAEYHAELLNLIGGLSGISPTGVTWYTNDNEIAALGAGECPPEILWRDGVSTGDSDGTFELEQEHYPPTIYGGGRVNPTQNLVNAFPMIDGYPIRESDIVYDDQNPYVNRDPRLSKYIVVNGSTAGNSNTVINTNVDGTDNNALNKVIGSSTRTGYYMRKHLNQRVNLSSTSRNGRPHYKARLRYTELFLNYAEAANEAWEPTGKGSVGYSAYDVIKAIRQRAGIGLNNGDAYLESVKNDKEAMRELIRNERRLELCFEGFRFWDLRRWKAGITEPAKGIRIENRVYTEFEVENRNYSDYMIHGPIPYSEILKFNALEQNKGW